MKVLIKTLHGLEPVLEKEMKDLGFSGIRVRRRAVEAEGNLELVYRANLELRTALRILLPIYQFTAKSENELYDRVYEFDWSTFIEKHQTIAIDNSVFSEYFNHSKYATLKAKDAIVDQFRDKYGTRPYVDTERPDVLLNLHAFKENFSFSLDSSGPPLNQRGYRQLGHEAPLNEVLAAGMLKLSGWTPDIPLMDPMCGTGTILLEAAMMAMNMAPNLQRKQFGFITWNSFQPMLWNRVKMDVESKVKKVDFNISGGDIDSRAVSQTQRAMKMIGVGRDIRVRSIDFLNHHPLHKEGFIITNPPYGERIGENIDDYYRKMGDHLKHTYKGYNVWILSSNRKALKQLRLKPSKNISLLNGALECDFCEYQLY